MNELLPKTPLAAPAAAQPEPDPKPAAIRAAVIGPRRPYEEIAQALGCSVRAVYLLVDRYRIPYIRVLNRRYLDPADIQAAAVRGEVNAEARGRGRPKTRKAG